MGRFFAGFIVALLIVALAIYLGIIGGVMPARADGPLVPGERWAANTSLHAVLRREQPQPPYPFTPTDADLAQGAELYVQNCAVCHGTANTTPNAIARGLGVRPPQFNKNDVTDDPEGETYWKIAHGIRFTGMPAYARTLDEKSLWDLAFFLKRAPDQLTGKAKSIWENPAQVPPPTPMPALPPKPGQGSSGPPSSSSP